MSKFSFGLTPQINFARSLFDNSHTYKCSFKPGYLIPFLCQEVYPGDSFKLRSTHVIRTTTPFLKPILDDLCIEKHYFFVPNRLVYKWEEFMGENVTSAWTQKNSTYAKIPKTTCANVATDSLADYFGFKTIPGSYDEVNLIPFRAYALIWDQWFRNENIQAPMLIDKGLANNASSDSPEYAINDQPWNVNNYLGMPAKVNKFKDYFTTCFPEPQKGDAVDIPLNTDNPYVVDTWNNTSVTYMDDNLKKLNKDPSNDAPLTWYGYNEHDDVWGNLFNNLSTYLHYPLYFGEPVDGKDRTFFGTGDNSSILSEYSNVKPGNLGVDLSNLPGTINDLRYAFQLQKMLERDARYGTRYVEYLYGHFGVVSPDARLQRCEYLGGKRSPLNIQQVAQTGVAGTGESNDTPAGSLTAYSLTGGQDGFSKSFVEHGFLFGLMFVRQKHTYQQGVDRFWHYTDKYDLMDPVFARIGMQPVYKDELYNTGVVEGQERLIFGWRDAYDYLRFKPSRVAGGMYTGSGEGLDLYHLGDYYENEPTLNASFIVEKSYLSRVLTGGSSIDPFVIDIANDEKVVRVLPVNGTPGYVDHF